MREVCGRVHCLPESGALQGLQMIFIGVIGAFIGSFLNVVAYRVPRHESIVFPSSHCPDCHHALQPWELVPVLSWLMLRGRCYYCHRPIAVRYPVLELLTAGLFLFTAYHTTYLPARIAWWVFWMLLVASVGTDVTSMRVPDVLTYPGAVIVLLMTGMAGILPWGTSILGAFVCFLLLVFIHIISRGNMGLGDAKLYFSIGAIFGPALGVESLIFASASGALIGLSMRALGKLQPRQKIPFVPHIATGVILTAVFGHTWLQAYLRLLSH